MTRPARQPLVRDAYPLRSRDGVEWHELYNERAAIFEFLGGHPRDVAEDMARQLVGPPPRRSR